MRAKFTITYERKDTEILLLVLFFLLLPTLSCHALNLTKHIEYLGTPFLDRYPSKKKLYARNIWAMTVFDDRLFFGGGNSSNFGPAVNAGPVPVICYNPANNNFSTTYTVDEEQIDVFYKFGNRLIIPGHDSKSRWNLGSFYVYTTDGLWKKLRTLPNAIHVYSMAEYKNILFAGIGTQNGFSLLSSEDKGLSWKKHPTKASRIYNFLKVKDGLYALGSFYPETVLQLQEKSKQNLPESAYQYIPQENIFIPRPDISKTSTIFPDTSSFPNKTLKITKQITFQNKAVYIAAEIHNDHQSIPFGIYAAVSLEKENILISKIPTPGLTIPRDMSIIQNKIYLLLQHLNTKPVKHTLAVIKDLKNVEELFDFDVSSFVRSFAIHDGSFYFSLGGEVANPWKWAPDEISPDTGKVYRIKMPKSTMQ